jgi:hypothetical protein
MLKIFLHSWAATGSWPSSVVSEPLIRASMTRHRQGRIRSVTLWRNSTRVTVYHSARGRERTNGDSTMTSVAQDRRGGGTCTRIPPSLYVRLAGRSTASHDWLQQPSSGSSVIGCQRAPASGSSVRRSGPGSAYAAATPEEQRGVSAPGSTLGRRSQTEFRACALRSAMPEQLRPTTPKRATLRFFHSLLSFSSSSASRSCCCFTRPGAPRGVAAGQGPRGFGDLHVFDPRDQVSHSVHSEFALGPGFCGAFQP